MIRCPRNGIASGAQLPAGVAVAAAAVLGVEAVSALLSLGQAYPAATLAWQGA